jgi:hypothetical protein
MSERVIRLDPGFLKVSERFAAERGGLPLARFEFGDYRIISEGMNEVSTRPRRGLGDILASELTAFEEAEFSFTLAGSDTDTIRTRASITRLDHYRDSPIWNENELIHQVDSFSASFSPDPEEDPWVLTMVLHKGEGVEGVRQFRGTLTNGRTTLDLQEVLDWSDGHKPETTAWRFLGPEAEGWHEDAFAVDSWLGYTFSLHGRILGAVQVSASEFHKRTLWLRKDLDPSLRPVIANAAGALFLRSEKYLELMENLGWVGDR